MWLESARWAKLLSGAFYEVPYILPGLDRVAILTWVKGQGHLAGPTFYSCGVLDTVSLYMI